ncbi:hypothetical protein Tamer19_68230 [Cupriavidus sp. TA19]|nr:hypothetical protein Tamer19_68230 [Cupriavidus sp. TA19]
MRLQSDAVAVACVERSAAVQAVVQAGGFARIEAHAPPIANVAPCDVRDTNVKCGKEMLEHTMCRRGRGHLWTN